MPSSDVFTAMIKEELNQHKQFFLFKERELYAEKKYSELATKSLRQTRILSVLVLLLILTFSVLSIHSFINFGNEGGIDNLVMGVMAWVLVIISTIYYMRDIVEKKRCMERVLKLLDAREQFIQKKSNQ